MIYSTYARETTILEHKCQKYWIFKMNILIHCYCTLVDFELFLIFQNSIFKSLLLNDKRLKLLKSDCISYITTNKSERTPNGFDFCNIVIWVVELEFTWITWRIQVVTLSYYTQLFLRQQYKQHIRQIVMEALLAEHCHFPLLSCLCSNHQILLQQQYRIDTDVNITCMYEMCMIYHLLHIHPSTNVDHLILI